MTPRERAEALEREAEQTDDSDTWVVASDAWLDAGDATRAWYARVRSRPRYGSSVGRLITRERAEQIAHALEGGSSTLPIASGWRERPLTNEDRGALELFRFMALQPERVFAYYNPNTDQYVGDDIRSFMGDYLGTVVHRGRIAHPFGNHNARIQHVHVRAINGYLYRGTCALDSGTYCKLRRADPWLR